MYIYKAIANERDRELTIEHDEIFGYYLFVWDRSTGKSIADHLCDSLDEAFLEALDLYGVQRDSFKKVNVRKRRGGVED